MKPSPRQLALALAAMLFAAVLVPAALSSPSSDAAAVGNDFSGDSDITSCRFTQQQLQNTLDQLGVDGAIYAAGLVAEVKRELDRWTTGGCAAKAGAPGLRIVKVRAAGNARKESVTIRNGSKKTINLRRYILRDAADHTIRFKKTKIKRGATLRVMTGCRRGSRTAVRKGGRYYACRKAEFWDDAGDVVELLTPQGGLLSRVSY